MAPRKVETTRRSIFKDFRLHSGSVQDLVPWLDVVVRGRTPDGAVVPGNEWPLDHFMAVLDQHGSREQVLLVAEAAGELLLRWLFAHHREENPGPDVFKRLSAILSILEAIPAPPRVSSDLFLLTQMQLFDGAGPKWDEIRRQALRALALRPPTGWTAVDIRAFFSQYLDDLDAAGSAFDGLRRLSLDVAIDALPHFLRTLRKTQTPPHEVIWDIFREMEIVGAFDQARHLGNVARGDTEMARELDDVLKLLKLPKRYPKAYQAYAEGLEQEIGSPPTQQNGTPANGAATPEEPLPLKEAHWHYTQNPGKALFDWAA